jgi:hypothetical protein
MRFSSVAICLLALVLLSWCSGAQASCNETAADACVSAQPTSDTCSLADVDCWCDVFVVEHEALLEDCYYANGCNSTNSDAVAVIENELSEVESVYLCNTTTDCDIEAAYSCQVELGAEPVCETSECYCGHYSVYWDNYLDCFYENYCDETNDEHGADIAALQEAYDDILNEWCVLGLDSSSSIQDAGSMLTPSRLGLATLLLASPLLL